MQSTAVEIDEEPYVIFEQARPVRGGPMRGIRVLILKKLRSYTQALAVMLYLTIQTTSLADSLGSAYKARIPARPYWGSEYSITCTNIPTTAEAVFLFVLIY